MSFWDPWIGFESITTDSSFIEWNKCRKYGYVLDSYLYEQKFVKSVIQTLIWL